MKKVIYSISLFFSILLGSCDNVFLDRSPQRSISQDVIWKSDELAVLAVNGIYATANMDECLQSYCKDFTNWGPDGFGYPRAASIELGNASTRDGNFLKTYRAYYRLINRANDAIFNLADNPNVTPELAVRMTGEAKFFRAFSYLILWQLFGEVVIIDRPLPPSETYLPRNSVEEVKALIEKDLTDAVTVLPVSYSSAEEGRVTKGAASALLGRFYLYDQQWDKAYKELGKITTAPYKYDLFENYNQLFDYKWEKNNPEHVFALQMISVANLGSMMNQWYGGRSTFSRSASDSFASHLIFSTYTYADGTPIDLSTRPKRSDYGEDDEIKYGEDLMAWYRSVKSAKILDKRLQANFMLPTDTFVGADNVTFQVYWPYEPYVSAEKPAYQTEFTSYAMFSWRKFVNTGNECDIRMDSPNNIPIIRFADVLLMYAEALNEAEGPVQGVYEAVNRVRNRAGVVNLPTGLNKDEMRRYIRLERFHEFPGEGHLFFDVRRWKTAHTTDPIFGLNHDVYDSRGEKLFTRKFEEKSYLWPIPGEEMDINDKLTQNPGWN